MTFLGMDERISSTRRLTWADVRLTFAVAATMMVVLILTRLADAGLGETVPNPHGDPASCSSCHNSALPIRSPVRFPGGISHLCRSCHDGRLAASESHPISIVPSLQMARRIPAGFPLENGMLGCLSCHDVAQQCKVGRSSATSSRSLLRGEPVSHSMAFCFQCHDEENYRPFNAHDQLESGQIKTGTCLWCHVGVPDIESQLPDGTGYALRTDSFGVCNNCHLVNKGHPTGDPHMHARPPAEMVWHMSAYEMRPRMRLPFKQLEQYMRAAQRKPRSIPLDEEGRITCYSCHNPHEKGLLPSSNLRSVGAESDKATNHRLRAHGGIACRACHEK